MNKQILVIDDEEAVRKSFQLALEDSGYIVETADCGNTRISKFKRTKYDLIFLDLKMPDKNGADVLREIREINKTIPIYIVTAFHEEFLDKLESARKDNLHFELMQKPLGMEEINLIVNSILKDSLGS